MLMVINNNINIIMLKITLILITIKVIITRRLKYTTYDEFLARETSCKIVEAIPAAIIMYLLS